MNFMGQGFSRRRFLVLGAAGLAAAAAVPMVDALDLKGSAGAASVTRNPNLLWNGSFEVGSLSTASVTTAVWSTR